MKNAYSPIVQAWQSTSKTDRNTVIYTWKRADGTGNSGLSTNPQPYFVPGIPFEQDEPQNFLCDAYYDVVEIHPAMVPIRFHAGG